MMNGALYAVIGRKRIFDGWHQVAQIVVQDRTVFPEPTAQHPDLVHDLAVFHGDCVSGLEFSVVSEVDGTVHGVTSRHALFVEVHDLFRVFDEQSERENDGYYVL